MGRPRKRRVRLLATAACVAFAACTTAEPAPTTTETATSSTAVPTTTTAAPATTTTTPPPPPVPFLAAYEFPPGVIELEGLRQPSRVEAVLGVPAGSGPFPVAVVVHGLGFACTFQEGPDPEAFATVAWDPPCDGPDSRYLRNAWAGAAIVEQLAARGIVGLSIDVNAAYFWWGGEVSEIAVIDALVVEHLAILDEIAAGTLPVSGLGAFAVGDAVALVGHSRGGAFVEHLIGTGGTELRTPAPAAVALLATAGSPAETARQVPLLNVRAACDDDVGPEAGQAAVSRVVEAGGAPVFDVLVSGASHWALTTHPFGRPAEACASPRGRAISAEVAELVASFLARALLGEESRSLVLDEETATLTVRSGTTPDLTRPDPSLWDLAAVRVVSLDETRLPAIRAEDRFLTATQLEDF